MANILDKRPVDAEMTIFKTEVEPNKLNACIDNILMRVDRLETKFADVQPVKRGEWEKKSTVGVFRCSLCQHIFMLGADEIDEYHFCPNCGADMRGDENG